MSLPASCAACVFYDAPPSLCRRHAPGPGDTKEELAHWPKVRASARCGAGDAGDDLKPPRIVECDACLHFWQPGGAPLSPVVRQGRSREWWGGSGYCTRWAPSPSADDGRGVTEWKVVNGAEDGCGDGQAVEVAEEAERGDVPRLEAAEP